MVGRVRTALRSAAGVVNPLGWAVVALGLVSGATVWLLHWAELAILAAACAALLLLALPFLVGRTVVRVRLVLEPQRLVAGGSVAAGVDVTNVARRRLLPTTLELPVGETVHRYGLPALAPGATHLEDFTLRTQRRGVIAVGPATTRRGDPLSLFSRDVAWTGVSEVLVRPPMVALDSLGSGLLRDLEGVSIDAVSQSDLAFHALREYVPGDDLRHVHWRSSAKATSWGETQLLVRQYLDTRRSHATIVVDDQTRSWALEDDFETAMSVAASIAVRAVLDDFETSFVCGAHAASGSDGNQALDAVCRAGIAPEGESGLGLAEAAQRAAGVAPDTSLLFLVSGGSTGYDTFRRAAAWFPPEVRRIALAVDTTGSSTASDAGDLPLLRLADAGDLGPLLRWSVS